MKLLAPLLLVLLVGTGCATIITGTSDDVTIVSVPTGARFLVMPQGESGITPSVISLSSKRKHVVIYEKECHLPAQSHIDKHLSAWTFLNLAILVWPIGFIVDFGTGGAYTLDDNSSAMLLEDKQSCERMADGSLQPRRARNRDPETDQPPASYQRR